MLADSVHFEVVFLFDRLIQSSLHSWAVHYAGAGSTEASAGTQPVPGVTDVCIGQQHTFYHEHGRRHFQVPNWAMPREAPQLCQSPTSLHHAKLDLDTLLAEHGQTCMCKFSASLELLSELDECSTCRPSGPVQPTSAPSAQGPSQPAGAQARAPPIPTPATHSAPPRPSGSQPPWPGPGLPMPAPSSTARGPPSSSFLPAAPQQPAGPLQHVQVGIL